MHARLVEVMHFVGTLTLWWHLRKESGRIPTQVDIQSHLRSRAKGTINSLIRGTSATNETLQRALQCLPLLTSVDWCVQVVSWAPTCCTSLTFFPLWRYLGNFVKHCGFEWIYHCHTSSQFS